MNGQPAKPERDDDWLLVPLPRGANRDQAFAVDIVYAEKPVSLKSKRSQPSQLARAAHRRAEHLCGMATLRADVATAGRLRRQHDGGPLHDLRVARCLARVCAILGQRHRPSPGRTRVRVWGRGTSGVGPRRISAAAPGAWPARWCLSPFVAILASMMLPALSKAKAKAQRISAVNNLKQVALAARPYANDHERTVPEFV